MTEIEQNNEPRLGRGVSFTLLLSSVIWLGLWIMLIVVARHADSLQKMKGASQIIWGVGIAMIIAGMFGAWHATGELAGNRKLALALIAGWLWVTAGLIAVGRTWSHWPWVEIIIGAAALIATVIVIQFRKRK